LSPCWRHRQIAGTPTRPSNTKRLADKAPVAGVTTRGMVTASRGEADGCTCNKIGGSGSSAAKSGSASHGSAEDGCCSQTTWRWVVAPFQAQPPKI